LYRDERLARICGVKTLASAIALGGFLALAGPAAAAPEQFSFTPVEPLTGELVTFSTPRIMDTITWDLDGDDVCNDASGLVATRSFPAAGSYRVKICVNGDQIEERATITVRNRVPTAAFTIVPANPVAREPVTFTSTAADPDGPIVAQQWDLNGDGAYDNASGEVSQYVWPRPGTYPVALLVTDRDGAIAVAQTSVVVAPRPPRLFHPAPVVRFVGSPTRRGARLELLSVTAPRGARVGIRCRGGKCPYKRKRFVSPGKRHTLRALHRAFGARTVIEIRVTRPETIGKFTRLRFRRERRPARLDRCLNPGQPNKLIACPTGQS
jgi:hypothetical protein